MKNKKLLFVLGIGVAVVAVIAVIVVFVVSWCNQEEPTEDIDVTLYDSAVVPEITEVTDSQVTSEIPEVYGFTAPTCEELIASDEYQCKLKDTILEPYAVSRNIDDEGYITYVIGFKNTEAQEYVIVHNSEESDYMYSGIANVYGSDYSVVLFNNGVPDNSLTIYNALYNAGISDTLFTTDYTTGSTVELTASTGEVFTLNLQ